MCGDNNELGALPPVGGPGHSAEPETACGLGPDGRVSASAGHTPGPWRWEVNKKSKSVELCGGPPKGVFGRYDLTVLSFRRYGMNGAAPVFWHWDQARWVGRPQRADELAVAGKGREHHSDWFALIDHPDARLIAAAPDLLAALQGLAPHLDAIVCFASTMDEHEPNRLAKAAHDAIAKATGAA